MKTIQSNLNRVLQVLFLTLSVFFYSCSTESGPDPDPGPPGTLVQGNGVDEEDLESYDGDLALLINTRELSKKGYVPTSVNLTTGATRGNYDQLLVVNPITNMAILSLSSDDLSEEAAAELSSGVEINLDVLDENGNTITSYTDPREPFIDGGTELVIDASNLNYVYEELYFNPDANHYIQPVDASGKPSSAIVWKPSSAGTSWTKLESRNSSFGAGTTSEQFKLHKIPNTQNEFVIYSANTGRYAIIGLNFREFGQSGAYSFPQTDPSSLDGDYRFIIERADNGLFVLRGKKDGNVLRSFNQNGKKHWRTSSGSLQYFRIVVANVSWSLNNVSTVYEDPILPPATTKFGYNATLSNCGSGPLEDVVGREVTHTTSVENTFSETIGLAQSNTESVTLSVSATAEASYFGNSASVTAEASGTVEQTSSYERTVTKENTKREETSETFFSEKNIVVPPFSKSLVYDSYQFYERVRVPYVKVVSIEGTFGSGNQFLNRAEMETQLKMVGFTGDIVTSDPSNPGSSSSLFIEVSLKGLMIMDNLVKSITEIQDVPVDCGN